MLNTEDLFDRLREYFDVTLDDNQVSSREAKHYYGEPFANLFPYRTYDPERELFINTRSIGFMLEISPLVGGTESTVKALESLLSDDMPSGTTINIIHWTSTKIGPRLDQWHEARVQTGGVYQKLADYRRDFYRQGVHQSIVPKTPFTLKEVRIFMCVSLTGKDSVGKTDTLLEIRDSMETSLSSAQLHSALVDGQAFIRLFDEWLNHDLEDEEHYQKPFRWHERELLHHQVSPTGSGMRVKTNHLSFNHGEWDLVPLVATEFPEEWAQWQNGDLLGDFYNNQLRIPYPVMTSLTFTYGRQQNDKMYAEQRHSALVKQLDSALARLSPTLRREEDDWRFAKNQIQKGQRQVKAFYSVTVYAPRGERRKAAKKITNIYKNKDWRLTNERFVCLQTWLASLPFVAGNGLMEDLKKLNRTRSFFTRNCANLAPLQGEWQGHRLPLIILVGRRGQLLFWNPFDTTDREGNFNVCVSGLPGQGKSVFMQEYVASTLGAGGRVVVIDVGRSFLNSGEIQSGQHLSFSLSDDRCINPFSMITTQGQTNDKEYKEYVTDALNLIMNMVQAMCRSRTATSDIENAFIELAVNKAWETKGRQATMTTVQTCLREQNDPRATDLAIMMSSFCQGGSYEDYFEGEYNVNLKNPLVIFELEELKGKEDLQTIVLMLVMFLVTQNMYLGDRKTRFSLVVDEAWELLYGVMMGSFIEGVARRARKYGGNLVTGTQGILDYFKNPAAQAAFENSDWNVMFAQSAGSIKKLQAEGRLTSGAQEKALRSIQSEKGVYSECMICGPKVNVIGRLFLDRYSLKIYNSNAHEFAEIQDYVKAGFTTEQAIETILAKEQTSPSRLSSRRTSA